MEPGTGDFIFRDRAAGARQSIRVYFHRPRSAGRDARIIIALHGFDRAARAFRDVLVGEAERRGQLVLVPEFDGEAFPGVHACNYGNVTLAPPSTTVVPRDRWTFGLVDRLFEHVRRTIGSERRTFGLFGNSAGAQYVLRYLALMEGAAVDQAVASNCGWYILPDLAADYPIGMAGLHLDDGHLRRYLARRLIILLGDADTDRAASDLPRMPEAMAQGAHRLERGLWYFNHCRQLADRLGVPFGWRLEIVAEAGHVSQEIFDRAARTLAS